jgi:hypothetical protein
MTVEIDAFPGSDTILYVEVRDAPAGVGNRLTDVNLNASALTLEVPAWTFFTGQTLYLRYRTENSAWGEVSFTTEATSTSLWLPTDAIAYVDFVGGHANLAGKDVASYANVLEAVDTFSNGSTPTIDSAGFDVSHVVSGHQMALRFTSNALSIMQATQRDYGLIALMKYTIDTYTNVGNASPFPMTFQGNQGQTVFLIDRDGHLIHRPPNGSSFSTAYQNKDPSGYLAGLGGYNKIAIQIGNTPTNHTDNIRMSSNRPVGSNGYEVDCSNYDPTRAPEDGTLFNSGGGTWIGSVLGDIGPVHRVTSVTYYRASDVASLKGLCEPDSGDTKWVDAPLFRTDSGYLHTGAASWTHGTSTNIGPTGVASNDLYDHTEWQVRTATAGGGSLVESGSFGSDAGLAAGAVGVSINPAVSAGTYYLRMRHVCADVTSSWSELTITAT